MQWLWMGLFLRYVDFSFELISVLKFMFLLQSTEDIPWD
jgi:hypothetical protein